VAAARGFHVALRPLTDFPCPGAAAKLAAASAGELERLKALIVLGTPPQLKARSGPLKVSAAVIRTQLAIYAGGENKIKSLPHTIPAAPCSSLKHAPFYIGFGFSPPFPRSPCLGSVDRVERGFIKVQACWRGHVARKAYKKMGVSATSIQFGNNSPSLLTRPHTHTPSLSPHSKRCGIQTKRCGRAAANRERLCGELGCVHPGIQEADGRVGARQKRRNDARGHCVDLLRHRNHLPV